MIFKSRLVQLLCNEKGQAQLDQGAYSLIQPQIQSLQGWGINHISGQPVQYILNIFLVFLFGFDLTCLFLFVCSFVLFFFSHKIKENESLCGSQIFLESQESDHRISSSIFTVASTS